MKKIIYGIKNHPGNLYYILFLIIFMMPGIQKWNLDIFLFGLVVYFILFLPLYLITSYQIGKANREEIREK